MTEPLWRWPDLCQALDLPVVEGPDITGVSIDSRTVASGGLFVALTGDPGPRFNPSQRSDRDGHDFIDAAVAAGAAGVLSHDGQSRSVSQLQVQDTLDGLWALGEAARRRLEGPVVAITGSSGKTTTKTRRARAMGAFATPGSLNNHLGVPLSLARTPAAATAAVFEIGTNHPGEIGPLSELVQPDVAVLLNVHRAHAENFTTPDELRLEKLNIVKGLTNSSHFVVEDTVNLDGCPHPGPVIRFGRSEAADVRLLGVDGERARYRYTAAGIDGEVTARIPGGGSHRALSLAAVIGVFLALDRDPAPALTLADDLIPRGRGNRLDVQGVCLIDDSYNANPESMAAALNTLAAEPGRKVALLGEMLELGDTSESAHRELAPLCKDLDMVICVGEGMRPLADALTNRASGTKDSRVQFYEEPTDALLRLLTNTLAPGDTVLVKGSNRVFWARNFFTAIQGAVEQAVKA